MGSATLSASADFGWRMAALVLAAAVEALSEALEKGKR
jgi:hypothetical protein